MLLELAGEVRGVERNARGARRDAQERDRHFGPAGKHDTHAIAGADAETMQRRRHGLDLGQEARVGQRRAPRREQRDRVRVATRRRGQQREQRARGHVLRGDLSSVSGHARIVQRRE